MTDFSAFPVRIVSPVDGALLRAKDDMIALLEPVVVTSPDGTVTQNHRARRLAAGTLFMVTGINIGIHSSVIEILVDGVRAQLSTAQRRSTIRMKFDNKVKSALSWIDDKATTL